MGQVASPGGSAPGWLPRPALNRLIELLWTRGYRVLGPVPRDGAVVWDEIRRPEDLPVGLRDRQEPGSYRLEEVGDERVFGVVNGPGSAKAYSFPPREELLRTETDGRSFRVEEVSPEAGRLALLGLRACDLAGVAVQDRIFLRDRYPDPYYGARRESLLLIAVNCTRAVSTCFCTSMGTGPAASSGFDLALTELDEGFTLRADSRVGQELVDALSLDPAPPERLAEERAEIDACAASITRRLDTHDLPGLLYGNLEHPRWDDVAERCLSCGNCTLVCPTCFCHDEREEPWLDREGSVRVREWDSCFAWSHARVHGYNFRPQIRHRYRQWLMHKLGSWIDQFGTSGCVGCGRCIAWCPVGIDLTEELAALREGGA